MADIECVVLVHRLREVVAQVAFTRFDASRPDIEGELDAEFEVAPLSLEADWLPAVENRGEGIFTSSARRRSMLGWKSLR